jgi:hypothetical protein
MRLARSECSEAALTTPALEAVADFLAWAAGPAEAAPQREADHQDQDFSEDCLVSAWAADVTGPRADQTLARNDPPALHQVLEPFTDFAELSLSSTATSSALLGEFGQV